MEDRAIESFDQIFPFYLPLVRHDAALIMNVFSSSTTARARTVIESSYYFGRSEAVEYRDIERYALRDNEYPVEWSLGGASYNALGGNAKTSGSTPILKLSGPR
jgi:hypothetical protein